MKYLKSFEYLIKKTDPVAENNPLRNFAERLKKIIEKFKNPAYGYTLKILFDANGNVTVAYNSGRTKLLNIKLERTWEYIGYKLTTTNTVEMIVFSDNLDENCTDFQKFIDRKLKKYFVESWMNKYKFQISEIDDIIQEIEEYYTQLDVNKFNI